MFFSIFILKVWFNRNLFFLSKFSSLVIVFDLLLIPLLNLPEKLILSLESLILDIDITSCNLQKVIKETIL